MCGIAGIVRFDGRPIDGRRVEALQAQLRHRGPDGEGVSEYPGCTLAHARLSIIDLLSGSQPMHIPQCDHSGPLHLVFNGEIYNHRDLRKQLERLGHRFLSDHSDTEVLLFGYRQWGTELPKHVHGMFAFAIWDEDERTLFLARDRAGKKPLYIRRDERELMFASLVSAMVVGASPEAPAEVDEAALLRYLRLGYTFSRSMIRGVTELPPAHWMTLDAQGRTTVRRYWRPPPISRTSTSLGALESLEEVLTEGVTARLESDVPLGCFLSGGIDSSVVAALAQRALREMDAPRLHTFSVAMPHIDYDESQHARHVARHIDAEHEVLSADPANWITDLQRLMAVTGEPTADSSLLPTYWLCRAAKTRVSAVLSGDGGDELFGGYDRYRAVHLLDRHDWWVRGLPRSALQSVRPSSWQTRLRRMVDAARAGNEPAQWYRSLIHLFTEQQVRELSPERLAEKTQPGVLPLPHWPDEYDHVHAAMRWDFEHYLPYELLRKVDRASMAVALEVRCPLLDTQVMDFAGHLPTSVLTPRGRPKGLLRQLASKFLPESIVARGKRGFAVPIGDWFRGPLTDDLRDHLLDGALEGLGIADAPVRAMLDDHIAKRADHAHRLFGLLQLVLWSRWLREPKSP